MRVSTIGDVSKDSHLINFQQLKVRQKLMIRTLKIMTTTSKMLKSRQL